MLESPLRNAAGVLFLFLLLSIQPLSAQQGLPDFVPLVDKYADAVVSITSETAGQSDGGLLGQLPIPEDSPFYEYFKRFFDQAPEGGGTLPRQTAMGSGFIISQDGYIMTNAHVVEDGANIKVTLSGGRELTAKVIGQDPRTDVALVKVDASGLPYTRIGDSDKLDVGQWVMAIGAPFGLEHTATQGIISALGRSLPGDVYVPFIQTDAAVNPGNSGGPLFNLEGEVIGVNSMIYSGSGGYMGVSFAIPINVAMDVAQQLRTTGKVSRGWLGVLIQEVTPALAESFGLKEARGALIGEIMPEGPAAKSDLKVGDIIVGYDGEPVPDAAALPPMVGQTKPGTTVPVTVIRNGREQRLRITIEELPLPEEEPPVAREGRGPEAQPGRLNIAVTDVPPEIGTGVIVEQVAPGPAASAGIRPGDIIERIGNQAIRDSRQYQQVVKALPAGKSIPVLIRRDGQPLFLALQLPGG